MDTAILVLQYPDPRRKRTVALAATSDREALKAFKRAAPTDAKLACIKWGTDILLQRHGESELQRLEELFKHLVPDDEEESIWQIE